MAIVTKRTCKAKNRRGEPCGRQAVSEGLCNVHKPGGQDMRALGRAGGKARRGGPGKQLPPAERESLREELRKLDPAIVRGAIEQALSGGNESARVSAVKLLADIDAFSRDGVGCRVCEQVTAEAPAVRDKLNRELEAYFVRAVQDHDGTVVAVERMEVVNVLERGA